jgi:hypothetical protein
MTHTRVLCVTPSSRRSRKKTTINPHKQPASLIAYKAQNFGDRCANGELLCFAVHRLLRKYLGDEEALCFEISSIFGTMWCLFIRIECLGVPKIT